MVELPYLVLKSKGKTFMVEEPSHAKQRSLNHERKIGLKTEAFSFNKIRIKSCYLFIRKFGSVY